VLAKPYHQSHFVAPKMLTNGFFKSRTSIKNGLVFYNQKQPRINSLLLDIISPSKTLSTAKTTPFYAGFT
jgi:hypothetical protein